MEENSIPLIPISFWSDSFWSRERMDWSSFLLCDSVVLGLVFEMRLCGDEWKFDGFNVKD